ncbi:MAG: aldehyde dehydrogenase family protein [Candidatus Krumholzibacteriia bacterium]
MAGFPRPRRSHARRSSVSRADQVLDQAQVAAREFRELDQAATDRIVHAVYLRALDARVELAKMAVDETGLGVWQDKVIKNLIATQLVYEDIRRQRTVGVISDESCGGIVEVARPMGPVLAFVPVTNPSSTTIFKILIALKTRNPLIVSPPRAARRTCTAAAALCAEAAVAAGAPEHAIQWLAKPTPRAVDELMRDPRLAVILATGTSNLVQKALQTGRPVLGVGPGNVPVYIGGSADVHFAVHGIMESKLLDNGTVCASEQAVVVKGSMLDPVLAEFAAHGAYLLTADEAAAVGRLAFDAERGTMAAAVVGQPAARIAQEAGVSVPPGTRLLLARLDGVGPAYPLSAEILAPILGLYVEDDFDAAIARCSEITRYGGTGHTAVIYSNNDERIEYFSRVVDAGRILVNVPATQGALGGMVTGLEPSFMLSCGPGGGNVTMDNITARHLLNIHRVARRQPNPRWHALPREALLDPEVSGEDLARLYRANF